MLSTVVGSMLSARGTSQRVWLSSDERRLIVDCCWSIYCRLVTITQSVRQSIGQKDEESYVECLSSRVMRLLGSSSVRSSRPDEVE